jgi:hypothetical protein
VSTRLKFHKIEGYKYLVAERVTYAVPELGQACVTHRLFTLSEGMLVVEAGYAWNGPSGPTVDTPASINASLPHDVVYQCICTGLLAASYKPSGDAILHRLMREYPAKFQTWANIRARYYLWGVQLGGWWATRRKAYEQQDKVYAV